MDALLEEMTSDLLEKLPAQRKTRRDKIATLIASMLHVQNSNLMVLASGLPRNIASQEKRYQYIERYLSNKAIEIAPVMEAYAGEIFERFKESDEIIQLMLDQSQIRGEMQVLMLSVRIGKRALPVLWCVCQTKGNIGWEVQHALLDQVVDWIPQGTNVILSADRFYGTSSLVAWCQKHGWGYRLRLKGNLIFHHDGGTLTAMEARRKGLKAMHHATFHNTDITTHIGILHDKGHAEPWFIAMDAVPSRQATLEYGKRWGIESLFSDFKSRGFGITSTHIKIPERLEKLLMILALALYWATSNGMWCHNQKPPKGTAKKNTDHSYHSSPQDYDSSET